METAEILHDVAMGEASTSAGKAKVAVGQESWVAWRNLLHRSTEGTDKARMTVRTSAAAARQPWD
jgi:hypothetical protein